MWTSHPQTKDWFAWLSITLLSVTLVLFASWQTVKADDGEWLGRIEALPDGGQSGDWTVRGRTFAADEGTEFRTEHGDLVMGACVEVEFTSAEPGRAAKIASKSDDDCNDAATPTESPSESPTPDESATPDATPSVTPSVTPTDDNGDDNGDDHEQEARGTVDAMPDNGLTGDWQIEGVAFIADNYTEFGQHNGPLMVGACVEIEFSGASEPFALKEIKTEHSDDCTNPPTATSTPDGTSTPTATPTATHDPLEHMGQIETLPSGAPGDLTGDWVVDGVTYTADDATEFHPDHGDFVVDACVKVHTTTADAPFTIREIETLPAFRCTGGGDDGNDDDHGAEGEIFGLVQSFPADLVGPWNVGGMTFTADDLTEFNQEHGAFAVDALVKVHFIVDDNGLNYAQEIETVYQSDDDGDDDDGNGSFEGAEGHAYGPIETFPVDLVGQWIVAGVSYTAMLETRFDQEEIAFDVGVRVKVEYHLDAQGQRIAQKIEVTADDGGASTPDHFTLFGSVRQMPPNGFVGAWQVDTVDFQAEAGAEFKEENGLLGLGAYVKVEYVVRDGLNQIVEIETHVPPGAGPNSTVGVIEDQGGALQAAGVQATTWTIGGVNYTITAATDLNDVNGALVVGSSALVNSYTAGDGSQVATQVRGVTLAHTILLPLVSQ